MIRGARGHAWPLPPPPRPLVGKALTPPSANAGVAPKVLLDQERERSNRLERAKQEEDEALSGELRDIMANMGTLQDPPRLAGAAPPSELAASAPPTDRASPEDNAVGNGKPGPAVSSTLAGGGGGDGAGRGGNVGTPHGGDAGDGRHAGRTPSPGSGVSAGGKTVRVIGGWSVIPISQGGDERDPAPGAGSTAPDGEASSRGGEDAGGGSPVPPSEAVEVASEASPGEGLARTGSGGVPQGILRARVVELELQRQEALDALKQKAEESLRLEVQVMLAFSSLVMDTAAFPGSFPCLPRPHLGRG